MRIAILTNSFPPDGRGGAERIAFLQADGFGVMGHEVKVWAAPLALASAVAAQTAVCGLQSAVVEQRVHGIEVERFPSQFGRLSEMSVMRRLAYHLFVDRGSRRDVAGRIVDWKPDVLLTHPLTGCGLGTARLVQSSGVRWVHTLHDIQLTDPSGQETPAFAQTVRARAWRAFWSAWRRRTFGVPDVVVSPTKWLLDWHANHGWFARDGARTVVLPNPVSLSAPRERRLRRPATVAYVGRLARDKGFEVFLDSLKRLEATVVGRAIVVGEGPLASVARDTGDNRLLLRGVLSPEDARRVIAEADMLIAPSRILENQQTILLEAMAEGTPVIASDTGGTKETLEDTGCPVIATGPGMAAEFETAARRLLGDEDEWTRVSRAIRERAKRHDPERYFSSLLGFLSG